MRKQAANIVAFIFTSKSIGTVKKKKKINKVILYIITEQLRLTRSNDLVYLGFKLATLLICRDAGANANICVYIVSAIDCQRTLFWDSFSLLVML